MSYVKMATVLGTADPSPSPAQSALCLSTAGEPLTAEQLEIYLEATDGPYIHGQFKSQISIASGRRGGKTEVIVPAHVRWALHNRQMFNVSPTRPACILIVSNTIRHQSRKTYQAVRAAIMRDPDLAPFVSRDLAGDESSLEFETWGISIRCVPNNPRAVRGYTAFMLIYEECDFWIDSDGQGNFDAVSEAAEPALATFDRALTLKISSPAGPGSPLHKDFERRHQDPDLLFWQLGSEKMNPDGLSKFRLAAARLRGEAYYSREYGAQFVEGGDALFPWALIEPCIDKESTEIPPARLSDREFQIVFDAPKVVLAIDMGGRVDACAFAVAVGQRLVRADEREIPSAALLKVEQWKPQAGSPVDTPAFLTRAFQVGRSYGATVVVSDRVDSTFVESYANRFGMEYRKQTTVGGAADVRERYYMLKEMLQQKSVCLINDSVFLEQLRRLRDFLHKGVTTSKHDDVAVSGIQAIVETISGPALVKPWHYTMTVGPSVPRIFGN